ncbi:E3 ubiquitin/ISG15 ligase TRIM25-like isoform X1 [Lethenteron reissneri]|uniref:E3 ubiquitin/ISG15 ligase TRIM25-like isoform X1 n=1 Tax=Lethenteron reissneri TaxID=7753 RepID=UPI002AB78FD7|nr:E3 ubiquitin/ISG15 ligase TRIM25-like isoform X1 [Lethenteron reissneri]
MGGSSSSPTAPNVASEELTCSICLATFDCPSTLSCGHSFCLRCLEDAWEAAGSHSCPQCRAEFTQKPQLSRNVALANLVEQLHLADKAALQVPCDSCLDGKEPAVRTCPVCEMSFCEPHGKHHLQNPNFKDHELMELGANTGARKCKLHNKRLEFYCAQDECLVCTRCAIVGEHTGHKCISVEDAHEARKKPVEEKTRAVEENKNEAEESVKQMEAVRKNTQEPITKTKDYIAGIFTCMRKVLDEEERIAFQCMDLKGRELLSPIDERIAHYQWEIGELQQTATRLQALEEEKDSLTFMQGYLEETHRRNVTKKSPPPIPPSLDPTTISSLERVVDKFLPFIRDEDRAALGEVATADPTI